MITLQANALNQNAHEVVIFGNIIVVDRTYYKYDELDDCVNDHYPHLDLAKIQESFELNKQKFPDESKFKLTLAKLTLSQLVAIAAGTENQDMMKKLIKCNKIYPRCVLARRSDLSEVLQLVLARDKEQKVLSSLALNPSLTNKVFNVLIKKADLMTKQILALRLNANDKTLEILATDKDKEVRRTVYHRPGLTQYLREYLSEEFGN